jgi:hypothetical protein
MSYPNPKRVDQAKTFWIYMPVDIEINTPVGIEIM